MNTEKIEILELEEKHYQHWLVLFKGYAEFYKSTITEESIKITWGWLMNSSHPCQGIVATYGGDLVGFAHYREMPSPLRGTNLGFLDDLFVAPITRGKNVAEILIKAVQEQGRKNNWPVIRWITRDNNYRARGVYDKLAVKTDWNLYELKV